MAQINTRDVVLMGLATKTTTGRASDINLPQGLTSAFVVLDVQTVSGTSPTLDVKVQNKLPLAGSSDLDGVFPSGTAFYDDLLAFAQATTTNTRRIFRIGAAGNNVEAAATDGALTAATARNGALGGQWAVKFVLGGTTPSFAFSVTTQFIP